MDLTVIISWEVTAWNGERAAGGVVVSDGYSNAGHLGRFCFVSYRPGHFSTSTLTISFQIQ